MTKSWPFRDFRKESEGVTLSLTLGPGMIVTCYRSWGERHSGFAVGKRKMPGQLLPGGLSPDSPKVRSRPHCPWRNNSDSMSPALLGTKHHILSLGEVMP